MNASVPQVQVTFADDSVRAVPYGTPVGALIEDHPCDRDGLPFLGALINNDCVTLTYPLEVDSRVEFITLRHPLGWRIFRSTAAYLLSKTVRTLFPKAAFAVEHSLGGGTFCSFSSNGEPGIPESDLRRLEQALRDLVARDAPIVRRKIAFADAVRRFEADGETDKFNLLRFQNPPKVVVYECEGFTDLAHAVLATRTGVITPVELVRYETGFVLQLPERRNPAQPVRFDPQPKLFHIFAEHKERGRFLGLRNAGDLNRAIADGGVDDLIKIAEGCQEKNAARIADHITENPDHRWILIAGPSASGKTTFTKRLAVQLRVNGLQPVMISVDDYFVERARTPRDEHGQPDFEHLETVDLPFFNDHLRRLDRGEEIELPSFDFHTGTRVFRGARLQIGPRQPVIIEGIHALNPKMTDALPPERTYRIYISALTQLNLDAHNRIATTDNRLLRRMVRDSMYRGHNAVRTFEMWPGVRRGEKRWIFPFQNQADVMFNSALDYELAVLKPLAEPLLREVKPTHASYAEARRLLAFLESFLELPIAAVPPNSILREFVGQSSFKY